MRSQPGFFHGVPRGRILPLFVLSAAVLGLIRASAPAKGEDRVPLVPDFKVEKYTLPNGLEVILHEDHATPVVGVNVWYKVGSKNEKRGRTGFAHLFEHLMFQGSKHHDSEYFGPIEKVGAVINGSTSNDRTNYFETLPSNALELALWLESDRMGFLLPALTQAKLDNQRDVVKNERRQRVDNQPYGQAAEKLDEMLYPKDHPYYHSVIGSMADLSAASLSDVSAFFRTYYAPNNASLVVAGDIDVPATKALIAKYFGPVPRGPEVGVLSPWIPKLEESKHETMTDRVTLPLAQIVWPTVAHGHPDEKAIDVLAAILGQLDKENRLYRALQYDRRLAAQVQAAQFNKALAGEFTVTLLAQPGGKLEPLVKIADEEIERLKKDGPTEGEVRKARNAEESSLILGLQATQRKADFLNMNNVMDGDPLAYKKDMAKLFAVTAADVKRVANEYLTSKRIRLDVLPGPPTPRAPEVTVDAKSQAPIANPPAVAIKDSFDRSKMPPIGPTPKFTPPAPVRRKLSNGLELLIAERHELPILTLSLVVKGGETLVPTHKHGLAAMTADIMTEGTKSRDALQIAGQLAELGASLGASGGLESSGINLTTLTKHTPKALDLFTDVLLHPTFPAKELDRIRTERLAAIKARSDQAESVAGLVFAKLLYGDDHPYGRPDLGTVKSIDGLTREDMVDFHKKVYVPEISTLIVVGDTTPDAITDELEKALKDWKPGKATRVKAPEAPKPPKGRTIYLVDKPAAAQSVLEVGLVGVPRATPDYFPLMVMNAVFGGQFSSRINLNLREDKGYTYGARSAFHFRQGAGPFTASAPVQTAVTKEALSELFKEVTDITGKRPVTDAELAFAKDRIIKGFPAKFETTANVAGTLADVVVYDLPEDYFRVYPSKVEAVSSADVARVAKKYLDPERLTILVVGDRSKIEGPIKSLPFVKVVNVLDVEGNPVVVPPPTSGGTGNGN